MAIDDSRERGGLHAQLTQQIIDAAHRVHRALGSGFLEKVYENALAIELVESDLKWCSRRLSKSVTAATW